MNITWMHLFTSPVTVVLLIVLTACGRSAPPSITPVGASADLHTFVYLYTEN